MKATPIAVVLLLFPQIFARANFHSQSAPNATEHKKYCAFSPGEVDVYKSQLSRDSSPKRTMVVMATTIRWIDDIDGFNLQLAVQGRAIPPDVRADFTEKNINGCLI